MDRNDLRTASRRVVLCALLASLMLVLQTAMAPLPNIEPVSLLILVCARAFGRQVFWIVYTFVLLEGLVFGFHLWWISGAFGLSFGALDALPYLAGGPWAALSRWIAGIPFDLIHCVGNFALALALEEPLYQTLSQLRDGLGRK